MMKKASCLAIIVLLFSFFTFVTVLKAVKYGRNDETQKHIHCSGNEMMCEYTDKKTAHSWQLETRTNPR